MHFIDLLKNDRVIFDGGTGTLLQKAGLPVGTATESWNLTHADELIRIHRAYYDAGCHVVTANTFGLNPLKYTEDEVQRGVAAAIQNVRSAAEQSTGCQEKFVALDIGPSGRLLKPLGDLDFEDAVSAFSCVVRAGADAGADLVLIETMNDAYETKAALLAVKEQCDLPVIVSNAYGNDGRLMSGSSADVMVAILEGMGADAIGVNCSLGPKALAPIVDRYLELASVPVLCMPNAGLPRIEGNETVFDVSAEEFAKQMALFAEHGLRLFGGCCGTTPDYIRAMLAAIRDIPVVPPVKKHNTVITSSLKAVYFSDAPILIGERINPTGKKRLKQALADNDMGYILNEGLQQQEKGVHALDVNVGAPDIDEKVMLPKVVCELQSVSDLPLQIDTADPVAMEQALRLYNGKALVNSVNGKKDCMQAIFPLVKKYGGTVIALTLDENGIPETVEKRVAVAEKILACAKEYGIDSKDIIFDPLTLTVSADNQAAKITLDTLRMIKEKLDCHTSLGVSNISFGLPGRPAINAAFFTLALENGLSAAIMNPYSQEMMTAYYTWMLLSGKDENCLSYLQFAQLSEPQSSVQLKEHPTTLCGAIERGLKDPAKQIAREQLQTIEPLSLVQEQIIPALNHVGELFEQKKVFLPQLLMSAEAAASAFEQIKQAMQNNAAPRTGCKVVLATVRGDIHDIGKNIVKLLLENYGFQVTDLGRDVAPEAVLSAVIGENAPLAGLSALMTTTVPAMEETIRLLHEKAPQCKVVVGGAVLTEEYAKKIGADHYARDAMETVRYAQSI